MTAREFAYWLQGMFELNAPKSLNEEQTEAIRRHLQLVFVHEIDPSAGPKETQDKLNQLHTPNQHLSQAPARLDDLIVRC
jgi:hypothetical protein